MNLTLEPETRKMLDRVLQPGFDYEPELVRRAACLHPLDALLRDYLLGLGLPRIPTFEYRRFCRSLTAIMRRYSGERLALEFEIVIARWQTWGLDPVLMQYIEVEAWNRLCEKSRQLAADSVQPESQTAGQPDRQTAGQDG